MTSALHIGLTLALLLPGAGGPGAAPARRPAPPAEIPELRGIVAGLRASGIDPAPVLSKAREGRAKRVGRARLLRVLRRYAAHLREGAAVTRRLFPRRRGQALVRAYADARLGGMAKARLVGLLRLLGGKRAAWAVRMVDVVADLLARGYREDHVHAMVLRLVKRARFRQAQRLRSVLATLRKRFGLTSVVSGGLLQQALLKTGADLNLAVTHLERTIPTLTRPGTPSTPRPAVPATHLRR